MLDKQCVEHYILISNSFFSLKILITPIAHCCAKYVECQIGDHLIAGQNTFEPLIVEHWIYVKKHSSDQKRCCSTVRSCTRWQSWHCVLAILVLHLVFLYFGFALWHSSSGSVVWQWCCSTVRSCRRWQSWLSYTAAAVAAQCCVCRLIWFCVCFCFCNSDTQ